MIRWLPLACLLALLTGCLERKPKPLGAAFDGKVVPISSARKGDAGSPVILQGTMIEKCPEAGCWFVLRDESGAIKVDTKDAGFVVIDVPLQISLTVAGRVTAHGTERILAATGLRY